MYRSMKHAIRWHEVMLDNCHHTGTCRGRYGYASLRLAAAQEDAAIVLATHSTVPGEAIPCSRSAPQSPGQMHSSSPCTPWPRHRSFQRTPLLQSSCAAGAMTGGRSRPWDLHAWRLMIMFRSLHICLKPAFLCTGYAIDVMEAENASMPRLQGGAAGSLGVVLRGTNRRLGSIARALC